MSEAERLGSRSTARPMSPDRVATIRRLIETARPAVQRDGVESLDEVLPKGLGLELADEVDRLRYWLAIISGCCERYRLGSGHDPATVESCLVDDTPPTMRCAPCKATHALGEGPVDRTREFAKVLREIVRYGPPVSGEELNVRGALARARRLAAQALDMAGFGPGPVGTRLESGVLVREALSFLAGDEVHHRPTGENWTLACDESGGKVSPEGWPESLGDAKDCGLLRAASFEERKKKLEHWAAMSEGCVDGDHRVSTARRQLAALEPVRRVSVEGAAPTPKRSG